MARLRAQIVNTRPWALLGFLCAVIALLCLEVHPRLQAISVSDGSNPSGLVLRILPEKTALKAGEGVRVRYELENTGVSPVYVCQWPGLAFYVGWQRPNGVQQGLGPGYPSSQTPARKYFIEIKPGEALLGSEWLDGLRAVPAEIKLRGEFRSGQSGEKYGLHTWEGTVLSEPVTLRVTRR